VFEQVLSFPFIVSDAVVLGRESTVAYVARVSTWVATRLERVSTGTATPDSVAGGLALAVIAVAVAWLLATTVLVALLMRDAHFERPLHAWQIQVLRRGAVLTAVCVAVSLYQCALSASERCLTPRVVQALRVQLQLSSTVLLVPICTAFARPLVCDATWMHTQWTCFGTTHVIVVAVCLLCFLSFGAIVVIGGYSTCTVVR
jgi:hypothetical protein